MRGMPTNDIGLPQMVMGICVVSRIFPVSLCTIMAINTKIYSHFSPFFMFAI